MSARVIGTRRSAMNRRRKGLLALFVPWLRRFGVLLGVAVLGVWLGAWLYLSGSAQAISARIRIEAIRLSAQTGFRVENVLVEGRVNADPKALKVLTETEKGSPLFAFDPEAVRAGIEKLDWIKRATVERRLPDTVFIRLEEHTPIAFWQKDGKLQLLNEAGGVISDKRLARFRDLIVVLGEDAPARAPGFLADLRAEPELAARAESARRVEGRRWDLLLKGGVTVRLPEEDAGLALRRLGDAQRNDKLLERAVQEIDMRVPGRISVRTKPGAVEEYRERTSGAAKGDNI